MDKIWSQIIVAFLMGALLPRAMLHVGSWMSPRETMPAETAEAPATMQTEATKPTESLIANYLPVLVEENRIIMMELEEYTFGVVLAEMPASFHPEALKAQAVAARTYALRRYALGDRHKDKAVCTDSHCCQAYMSMEQYLRSHGTDEDAQRIRQAVQATRGQVLTYGGKLAESTYFSCSGGRTEDAIAVWGTEIPYLQAVDSPGEEEADPYWRSICFSAEEFAKALGRNLTGSPTSWLGKQTFTEGNGVATMEIGGITYTGTQLRKMLGLSSTVFQMTADADGITVETLGNGHRVGMSQYGADAMAEQGNTYAQILLYYYRGTRIDKWENIG